MDNHNITNEYLFDQELQLMIIKEYVESLQLKILNNNKNKQNPLLLFAILNSFKKSLCL
jgi:hypothetical protein